MSNLNKKKVIFDFGAHTGQNIDYYLSKANFVVCVEANPKLVQIIEHEFSSSIHSKRLFIENTVVTAQESKVGMVDFYIHKKNDVLSTIIKPENEEEYSLIKIKSQSITKIINKYISNNILFYYAKFDLEGYDAPVIDAMFKNGLFPENISTEIHTSASFNSVIDSKKYKGFKLQEGSLVGNYLNLNVKTNQGVKLMNFLAHSAGPMGEDIPSPWLSDRSIRKKIKVVGFGWKDVHASMTPETTPTEIKKFELFQLKVKSMTTVIYQSLFPFSVRNNIYFKKITKSIVYLLIRK